MSNPIEVPNPIDVRKLKNFNNFHCYLPGGRYRDPDLLRHTDARGKKIIEDVDKTAKRLGIDIEEVGREFRLGNSRIWDSIRMSQESGDWNSPEAKRINDEGEAIRNEAHIKLIPLFEALIKLGYTVKELMA